VLFRCYLNYVCVGCWYQRNWRYQHANGTTEGGVDVERSRTIATCFDDALALDSGCTGYAARIVLAAVAGEPNSEIARRLQLTRATVGKWRARFPEQRINGLYDEVRPGKPRTIDDERVAELIHKTLHTKPADGSTHWSVRTIAAETTISATSVHRYFKLLGLQPRKL